MNKKIKIWFSDFTEDIDPRNNYLTNIINKDYDLIFDEHNPDYLIFAPYGYDFLKYKSAIKIYYTGENLFPDFNLCDYAIGFHHLSFEDRYLRFPLFAMMRDQFHQIFNREAVKDLSKNPISAIIFIPMQELIHFAIVSTIYLVNIKTFILWGTTLKILNLI